MRLFDLQLIQVVFLVLVAMFAMGMCLDLTILHRLRTRHPEDWDAIGRPRFFVNYSIASQREYWKFFKSDRFLRLEDEWLHTLVRIRTVMTRIYRLILIGVIGVVAYSIATR